MLRLLKLEVAELERSIAVTRRIVPQVPLLDADVAGLQRALLQARREAEQLSAALESPANMGRWRLLEGKVREGFEAITCVCIRTRAQDCPCSICCCVDP